MGNIYEYVKALIYVKFILDPFDVDIIFWLAD